MGISIFILFFYQEYTAITGKVILRTSAMKFSDTTVNFLKIIS